MSTVSYLIPSISCGGCKRRIEISLSALQGVQAVKVEVPAKKAVISFEAPATEETIKAFLASVNYPVREDPMYRPANIGSCGE